MFSIAADFRILPNPSENVRACPEMKKTANRSFYAYNISQIKKPINTREIPFSSRLAPFFGKVVPD